MPVRLSKQQRERFLAGRHVAVLVTVAPDGSPLPTPIWYRYRNDAFYFRTALDSIKTRHVQRDPRVSIVVQDERPPYKYVIAHGTASVEPASEALARELPRHYLGMVGGMGYERAARELVEQGPEITLVVRPEKYLSSNFTPETPLVGRAWLQLKRILPPWL
jgi:PPOX class probable F420-dependent enzyme